MQPYLFPYLGYLQLMHSVDAFVIYDDVSYIKGGWINRNFILGQSAKQRLTFPVKNAGSNVLINEVLFTANSSKKFLKTIRQNYSKAPYFETIFPVIDNCFLTNEMKLISLLEKSLKSVANQFGLSPQWYLSSQLNKDTTLRGQRKVLAICEELGATHYVNLSGGKELYDRGEFEKRGVELSFIEMNNISYSQFSTNFVANLSIIDVMMFNSIEKCQQFSKEYTLVSN